jgi:hypothetical protein
MKISVFGTAEAQFILLVYVAAGLLLPGEARSNESISFTVVPAAAGKQFVRTSLPLPRGFLGPDQALAVKAGRGVEPVGLRVLSWYPTTNAEPRSARRALVTFAHRFADLKPVAVTLQTTKPKKEKPEQAAVTLLANGESLHLAWKDGRRTDLKLIAPPRTSSEAPLVETIEENQFFRWQRLRFSDPQWPRVIESRLDSAGGVVLVAHLQRGSTNDVFAPELGWELTVPAKRVGLCSGETLVWAASKPLRHSFADGADATCLADDKLAVYHPTAPLKRRGEVEILPGDKGVWTYRYLRCRAGDKVPMQPKSWQRAEVVVAPPALARLTSSLNSPHRVAVEPKLWAVLYGNRESVPYPPPLLEALVGYHREAIVRSAAIGDDFGNVTGYNDGSAHGGVFGMNRLNHGAAIFEVGRHSDDRLLTETALLWCDNFYDQSIWWGENQYGGTRYNNLARSASVPNRDYMWRSDTSVSFCTKGYDCFWLAWEETGDPRMMDAFRAQIAYAEREVHANQGECRNIGDVRDFIRLYEYTGDRQYLDAALRLFRELRTKLSTGNLFDQGGKALDPNPPFIDEDQRGLMVGYAKPYIIGYALAGLPELTRFAPDEPDLKKTVRAVANFLAETGDPSGGWRYPHPCSSAVIISQGLEHAWQMTQAARVLGPEPKWLDAIETVLRARILGWQRTGMILSGLEGWEVSTGKVKDRMELYDLYKKPADRDVTRDYREGKISYGSSAPEGIVYFEEVLGFYLQHRTIERLLAEPKPNEPLGLLLARSPKKAK